MIYTMKNSKTKKLPIATSSKAPIQCVKTYVIEQLNAYHFNGNRQNVNVNYLLNPQNQQFRQRLQIMNRLRAIHNIPLNAPMDNNNYQNQRNNGTQLPQTYNNNNIPNVDLQIRYTFLSEDALKVHKKNSRRENALASHRGEVAHAHEFTELNAAYLASASQQLNRLGTSEDLIIVSHSDPPTPARRATFGNYTPQQLASTLVNMNIFPRNANGFIYKGNIYINGCETASNSSPTAQDSFIKRFKYQLNIRGVNGITVDGNVGVTETNNAGNEIFTKNLNYLSEPLGRKRI